MCNLVRLGNPFKLSEVTITLLLLGAALLSCTIAEPQLDGVHLHFRPDEKKVRSQRARQMLRSMDSSINPCHDFYGFACGNWGRRNRSASREPADWLTAEAALASRVHTQLQDMLAEQTTVRDLVNERKAKDFYKSCLAMNRLSQSHQLFLSDVMKNNSGFPAVPGLSWEAQLHHSYNWQQVVAQLRHRYGLEILIGLHVDINFQARHEYTIYFGQPSSTIIPPQLCSVEGTQRVDVQDREYERIERYVAHDLVRWLDLPLAQARHVAADIITFEFELCSAMAAPLDTESAYSNANYVRFELHELTHTMNDTIDFNRFVEDSFGAPIHKSVFISGMAYYRQLAHSVAAHNVTTIANYIMYRTFAELSFPLDDGSGHQQSAHCLDVSLRYFADLVGNMYLRHYASNETRGEIEMLFELLKRPLQKSFERFFADPNTLRIASKKLDDLQLYFPTIRDHTSYNSLQIDRGRYWLNLRRLMELQRQQQLTRIFEANQLRPAGEVRPHEPLLKYRPTQRRIEIGWALLQPPYYHASYPHAIRYAAIGHKLATQMAAAFDGAHFGYDPELSWDYKALGAHHNQTECFRQQLSNYLHNQPNAYNNVVQLQRLMAASGGLNVAFNAYLNWLYFKSPNNDFGLLAKETLPEYNFTNTQLFFLTFAHLSCGVAQANASSSSSSNSNSSPSTSAILLSALQQHSIERFQVNGPLRNSLDFAWDFGCATGTQMNLVDKCTVY